MYLPTVLVAQFPTPTAWSPCGTSCPDNAFAVLSSSSAVVDDVARPLREALTVVLWAAAAALLFARARQGGKWRRWTIAPVLTIAVARTATFLLYVLGRRMDPNSGFVTVLGDVYLFSLPAITLAFAGGLLAQRLFTATALERLAQGLHVHATGREMRLAMSDALSDPGLSIVYRLGEPVGRWVDEQGRPVDAPEHEPGRAVTEVRVGGRLLAAIVYDADLVRDSALVAAATGYALTALENGHLLRELETSLQELSESRARLVAVADKERRKIERDLHDGAQQRLVALRVKLELAAEGVEPTSAEAAATMRGLEVDVDEAIDEVRLFARGIYPALLADRGLAEALRAVGSGAPIPTKVHTTGIGRYSPEIEGTVYFACAEALQNVAKHAPGASAVWITVADNGTLHFEVRDDGAGFDADEARWGTGLSNIHDRLSAVGGTLEVKSARGDGTRIRGTISRREAIS
jgi:signal transduction histidine kinase